MNANAEGSNKCFTASQVREKIQEALKKHSSSSPEKEVAISRDTDRRFPEGMERLVVGMAQIERDEFNKKFDLGLPLDPSDTKNSQVLILYSSEKTLPSNPFRSNEAKSQTAIPSMAADEATENCDALHVILQDHSGTRRQCTAILGQYEAFHIQKFMRLPDKGKLDPSQPLRIVNRGAQTSGRLSVAPPGLETTQNGWKALQKYLNLMDDALKTLDPLAKKAAVDNSIVVQVCNFGQSELLLNFLCSAKRRGLDTSSILVFATDQETYDLVNQMGNANVVFLKDIFDEMPSKAAKAYGDKSFMQMMMAKVYCVHLIAMLGYDVLFQDVDVVWYRNPIHYFHDENALDASFDVYFQDDGNHALYYAPYSANTGFYYVRSNERTLHFLNSFLMAGDLVLQSRSHQIPLVALLQEHASMYGLKIKIFSRDGDTFPGGHAFHRRKTFMKDILEGTAHPEIFHMSWTKSKDNKKKFFEQMGEWFLQDKCTSKSMHEIYPSRPDDKTDMVSDCCSLEPRVSCHYRDKPSKIPCKDSPPIDTGAKSFW
ncbi:hypothetical protein ACA910_013003 [Epithemia clementina (nom. ined.)]